MRELLSKIPKVNDLLESQVGQKLAEEYSHQELVNTIREVTDKIRKRILSNSQADASESTTITAEQLTIDSILASVKNSLKARSRTLLSAAINATGVVIHTNLGRSLLANSAVESLCQVAKSYSTLEIDRLTGERGSRYNNVTGLLQELTGAEDCIVVNNNAAAVLLALSTFAVGKEVIISRGEMVEVGGSFRIPDVMKQSGAKLIEIGATNKVHLQEYQQAITEETALLLKVHTSNYRIVGFTKTVELGEIVQLGRDHQLPVMEDLGSGIMVDLSPYGLSYEPRVQDSIEAGVDIVTFSGDKLLGGPQAGIIVGKSEYIKEMKKHPLNRALRVDKFTLAALEGTLREYRNVKKAIREIPTLRMLTDTREELEKRAICLAEALDQLKGQGLKVELSEKKSRVGGGALPLEELPTFVLELLHQDISEEELARQLRLNNPPIFARVNNNRVILDLRTIQDNDLPLIVAALNKIVNPVNEG